MPRRAGGGNAARLAERRQGIASRRVQLRVLAGAVELDLRAFKALEVGNVIALDTHIEQPMTVVVASGSQPAVCAARLAASKVARPSRSPRRVARGEVMGNESMPGTGRQSVRPVQLEKLEERPDAGRALADGNLDLVQDVKVRLTMSVGGTELSIGELYALKEGALLKLDKATADPIDIFLDARLVARGELMVAGDHFAVRITEIGGKA